MAWRFRAVVIRFGGFCSESILILSNSNMASSVKKAFLRAVLLNKQQLCSITYVNHLFASITNIYILIWLVRSSPFFNFQSQEFGPRSFCISILTKYKLYKKLCSDSAIPNSLVVWVNSLATWLEWSTVKLEFWVRILADPKDFPLGIFTGGSRNPVAPELASGSGSGLFTVVVDVQLSGNKRGKSVVTVPFLTASLLG